LYPNNTAFQRFLSTGPLAWLPLDERNSTMVWSTRPDHAAAYKRLAPDALVAIVNAGYTLPESTLAELNDAILAADAAGSPLTGEDIRALLSTLPIPSTYAEPAILPPTVRSIPPTSVASFPLKLSHAESYLGAPGTRTVLVGDAAHTTHPLAGQGLNMGLADVRALANAWEEARRVGGDLGSVTSMAPYPRAQYPANQLLLSTVDTLHHVFRNRSGLINWARGMGLDVINELGPIKRLLMQGAGAVPSESGAAKQSDTSTDGRRGKGWPYAAASGLEGWLGAKHVVGQALGMAGQVVAQTIARAGSSTKKQGFGRD
jgi:ubiquinone biosynthesis monooxygenase Coq6